MKLRYLSGSLLVIAAAGACKDGPTPPPIAGPPAMLVIASGDNQAAPANTVLQTPARLAIRDANGIGVAGLQVTFAVVEGGGSIVGDATVTTDADGVATAPPWRLGKSNVPQKLRATHGSWTQDVTARIQTNYDIEIRFFGDAMTPTQQALFISAAARLEAIITGEVQNVQAQETEVHSDSTCGVTGEPPLNSLIDDILIYAAIDSIDGSGDILAQAGPCYVRTSTGLPIIGTMYFDEADLATIQGSGRLEDVIMHEMLHVIGFGTTWQDKNLLTGAGGPNPRFTGAQARAGCQAVGGTVSCANDVPVEGNTEPPGTRDGHWKESVFDTELMTGRIDAGALPISSITIGSLADIGYVVNSANNDPYTIALGALRAGTSSTAPERHGWEKIRLPGWKITPDGRVTRTRARR